MSERHRRVETDRARSADGRWNVPTPPRNSSRVVRVGIVGPAPDQLQPDAPPPRYTIRASQLVPRNLLANPLAPLPPDLLPFGAVQHALEPGSWLVSPGQNPRHPYSGFSVDFLEPAYEFDADMFDITPDEGACLPRTNSHTREAIAAAALGAAYPTASIYNVDAAPRLRLALEPVSQLVAPSSSASASRLDPDPTGQAETAPDPMERLGLNREALFALFSGRLPLRPWPTAQLVGLDSVNTADLPLLRAGRTDAPRNVFRIAGGGAFRGLEEWLTVRQGTQGPLAEIVEPDPAVLSGQRANDKPAARDDHAYVKGFRLRAKRTTTARPPFTSEGASASGSSGTADRWSSSQDTTTRRRGVGPNGGMAVLWQGGEPDRDRRPPITLVRADDTTQGGFVLRLPGSPPQPPTAPLPLGEHVGDLDGTHVGGMGADATSEHMADAVDSAAEGFFPVKAPARPLTWPLSDHTTATDAHGNLLACSLEGYWIGPYSSHGLEILNITTGLAEFPSQNASDGDSSDSDDDSVTYRQVVTATKVTGDPNVPSGQTSWLAILPASAASDRPSAISDGPVPSVRAETFHHLSSLDPSSPVYQGLNNGAGPDWLEGCVRGYGRIALTGYTSPSYSPAEIRFLRSEVKLQRPDQPGEQHIVQSIEEIHVRWLEMHKVTTFKRMRIA